MKNTARKWYKKLNFPSEYDLEFEKILENCDVSKIDGEDALNSLLKEKDYGLNLVYFLSKCEEMEKWYKEKNIPYEIFINTANDLVIESKSCKDSFGVLGTYEAEWENAVIVDKRIFRIGRLNFEMDIASDWCTGDDIKDGDRIILVHIPAGDKLSVQECYLSIRDAERFFLEYFPEYTFDYFVCCSWMMYRGIKDFLNEDSNVLAFQKLFTPYRTEEDNSLLKFVFAKNVNIDNVFDFTPKTRLQTNVLEHLKNGGKLYKSYAKRPRTYEEIKAIDCHYHQLQFHTDDLQDYPWKEECSNNGTVIDAVRDYIKDSHLMAVNLLSMPNTEKILQARDITQNIIAAIVKCECPEVFSHGALIYDDFPAKGDYGFLEQAKELMEIGFDGIKMIETKPSIHQYIKMPVSDSSYNEFFDYLEKENIHILWHVNDPWFCWDENGVYTKLGYPHYNVIYAEVEDVLKRHPKLSVTFAHFYFMARDLARLSDLLDRYENVMIDTTPAEEEYGYLSKNWEESVSFFKKYADRIMLGTDNKSSFRPAFKEEAVDKCNRFLRTTDEFKGITHKIKGLGLSKDEIYKISCGNFLDLLGDKPKPINKPALKRYIEKMMPRLPEGRTKEVIKDYYKNNL